MEPGPLALVGSGEYLPRMLPIEQELIAGRPPRYVQIPTAASAEGPDRMAYWVELGRKQAERMGVEAVPLVVADRRQADDPQIAGQVAGAGLIYLSGRQSSSRPTCCVTPRCGAPSWRRGKAVRRWRDAAQGRWCWVTGCRSASSQRRWPAGAGPVAWASGAAALRQDARLDARHAYPDGAANPGRGDHGRHR